MTAFPICLRSFSSSVLLILGDFVASEMSSEAVAICCIQPCKQLMGFEGKISARVGLGCLYTSPGWMSVRGSFLNAAGSKFCLQVLFASVDYHLMLTRIMSLVLCYLKGKTSQHYHIFTYRKISLALISLISFLHREFKGSQNINPPMVKPFRLTYLARGGGCHPLFKS